MSHWILPWKHGKIGVQALGGMYQIQFRVPSGKTVSPMYQAPWIGEPLADEVPAMLRALRGDWFCVPFGAGHPVPGLTERWRAVGEPETGGLVHGYASHHEWSLVRQDREQMVLGIDLPQNHPIQRLERTIRPVPNDPMVYFELRVQPRDDVSLPVGLHPTFRLPEEPGALSLEPGAFSSGITYPGDFEPGAYFLKPDILFDSLERLETWDGKPLDLSRLPLEGDSESLVQLLGVDGKFDLVDQRQGFRIRLQWDPNHFPSCAIWISNRGRKYAPWNGRNLALGIEPVCSAFEMGTLVSRRSNPISEFGVPTVIPFKAGEVWTTEYHIGLA